jgi:hypothetical protein
MASKKDMEMNEAYIRLIHILKEGSSGLKRSKRKAYAALRKHGYDSPEYKTAQGRADQKDVEGRKREIEPKEEKRERALANYERESSRAQKTAEKKGWKKGEFHKVWTKGRARPQITTQADKDKAKETERKARMIQKGMP